ncbi:Glycosyltransferase family 92 [Trinorchestia longiramus]|nr:Glycosyltransferase family 92 [Trinorchestia longiramus]
MSRSKKKFILLLVFCFAYLYGNNVMLHDQHRRTPKPIAQLKVHEVRTQTSFVDDWREIPGSGGLWFVYSAHFSVTPDGEECVFLVTGIAFALKSFCQVYGPVVVQSFIFDTVKTVLCHLWTSTYLYFPVVGKMKVLQSKNKKFSTALVWCPIEQLENKTFYRVTLSSHEQTTLNFTDALSINGYRREILIKDLHENKHNDARLQQDENTQENIPYNMTQYRMGTFKAGYEKFHDHNNTDNLAVCVRAMGGGYNNAARLIEFVELQKILGVTFFFFYNYSIGMDMDKVLQFYVKKGDAKVLPWSLPDNLNAGIHSYGQIASQADCHLRASRFSLVAMLDLDEAFIPKNETNLIEMVKKMDYYSSYRFRNVFFYNFLEDDSTFKTPNVSSETLSACSSKRDQFNSTFNSDMADVRTSDCTEHKGCVLDHNGKTKENNNNRLNICSEKLDALLVTQRKTKRVVTPSPYNVRSKYIMRPQHVAIPTVHYVHQFQSDVPGNRRTYNIPKNIALSHHYRDCERQTSPFCTKTKIKTDRTAHRYAKELVSAITKVLIQLCNSKTHC